MLSYICLVLLAGFVYSADVEKDVKNAVNEVTTTKDGDVYCPVPLVGTKCPGSSIFHYYKCCGELNKDCCFNLQVGIFSIFN
uniref:WAP domain-containing protein n=1 Tax=Heterorhabditis bacteriophora TaxID=37862 RepID=A0A1I7XAR4_HETBA